MKKIICLVTIGLTLFLMGCPARSLFPLFTEPELVFNPDLLGTWVNSDKEEYTFQKSSEQGYTVLYLGNDGGTEVFTVQLGQLGKAWFLDSYPASKTNDYHLLPTHVISQMQLSGDTLRLASLESDFFQDQVQRRELNIPHAFLEKDLVLTGATMDLQQLILSLADNHAAFPDTTTFLRRR